MVPTVTFPACVSVRCTDCPGLTGCIALIRSPAVCTGRPLAAVTMSPGLRPALAAGVTGLDAQQLRAQLLDRDLLTERALRHHLRGLLGVGHRARVLGDVLLVGLARRQHLVVGHQLGALDQVLRPQLLDQVGLQLVDVDEVEARTVGRRLAARCVDDVGGRVGVVGQEREVAGLGGPAVGTHRQHEEEGRHANQRPAHTTQQLHPPATASDPATVPAAISISPSATEGVSRPCARWPRP